jgi:hypothetical protein
MAALPNESDTPQFPEPLEFFQRDFIHPDNKAIIEREAMRWRLLGFWERIKLKRYVNSLAKQLRKAKYNDLVIEHHQLGRRFYAARAIYRKTTYISREAKAEARDELLALVKRGHVLKGMIADLKPTYELYQHYQGWLDYEKEHRRELQKEDRREKRIRAEMRRESKYLEQIIRDVWRHTNGCHYTYKKDGGKEKTKVPKIERTVIKPDAHHFYLLTSRRLPFFGYRWLLPDSVSTEKLTTDEVMDNLRAGTKRQTDFYYTDQNQLVFRVSRLDSPDALPRRVQWRDAMKFYPKGRGEGFPYTVGVTEGRSFHWLDLAADTNILVAGTQGSGKSNLVNGIIGTLVSTHTPAELRLVLIDQKGGIEFTHWKEIPHLLWEMVKTTDDVQPVLTRLVAVMRKRMTMLEKVNAKHLDAYNARVDEDQRLERLVIAIDEMSNFVGLGQRTEEIQNLIMLLASMGRAVGISLILCTQHPEVKVIPGRIKTNVPVRLCGWMPTIGASLIVLDNPEAARLHKLPGRFVLARGMETLVIQCPEITDDDIRGVVGAARLTYTDVANDIRDLADVPALVVWNEERLIRAALEWTEGQLSADKLHKMLGEESPGERHLRKLVRGILDQWKATAALELDEKPLTIKRRGKAYIVAFTTPEKLSEDKPDEKAITVAPSEESEPPSVPIPTVPMVLRREVPRHKYRRWNRYERHNSNVRIPPPATP